MNESNLGEGLGVWECSYVTPVWFAGVAVTDFHATNIFCSRLCNLQRREASYCIYISIVSTFLHFGVLTS